MSTHTPLTQLISIYQGNVEVLGSQFRHTNPLVNGFGFVQELCNAGLLLSRYKLCDRCASNSF